MGSVNETNRSLWVATTPEGSYPRLEQDAVADVAIIGAGITGLSCAYMLADAGLKVIVLESGSVSAGTTGYTSAKLTSLHGLTYASIAKDHGEDAARLYGEAAEAAIRWVADLVDSKGIECDLERRPAYTYTEDPESVVDIEREFETARSLGLPAGLVESSELPFEIAAAVRFDEQALFHPRKYCLALAGLATDAGVEFFQNTRVDEIDSGEPCTITAGGRRVTAQHVVQATQIPIHDPGGFFVRTSPTRSYCLAIPMAQPPEGMYLSIDSPSRSLRPHREGKYPFLIVGGEGHKVGQDPDTRQRYAALDEWTKQQFGPCEVLYKWSAQDYSPADGLPYIGKMAPGMDRMWVATGFNKWGMTTGTVAGMILTDRVLGRDNPWAEVFDTSRVNAASSVGKVVKENLNVAKHFVSDHIDRLTATDLNSVKPGDGAIVKSGHESVAAYRDEQGIVHSVSPVCTHLKCTVDFNTAEKTWDCPCHGSRFDVDGHVLQGPARKDLEPR